MLSSITDTKVQETTDSTDNSDVRTRALITFTFRSVNINEISGLLIGVLGNDAKNSIKTHMHDRRLY